MRCQRRILSVKWYDRVRNTEVSSLTGLESISAIISRRRSSLFSHVVKLATDTPVNRARSLTVDVRRVRLVPGSDPEVALVTGG